jgi:hypothetical protein
MARLAYASILFALMTTVASAQAPQPVPAAPRQAPGPAAQIHTNLPAERARSNTFVPNGNVARPTNASVTRSKLWKSKLRHNDSKSLSVLSYSPITSHD